MPCVDNYEYTCTECKGADVSVRVVVDPNEPFRPAKILWTVDKADTFCNTCAAEGGDVGGTIVGTPLPVKEGKFFEIRLDSETAEKLQELQNRLGCGTRGTFIKALALLEDVSSKVADGYVLRLLKNGEHLATLDLGLPTEE